MSENKTSDQQGQNQPSDSEALDIQEAIETIKQPPAIDDQMRTLSPEELKGNQAVTPETLEAASDLRADLQRD